MRRVVPVQAKEVHPIKRQHGAALKTRETKHFSIRQNSAALPRFLYRYDIVAERSKRDDHLENKVVIGTEPRHHSRTLVHRDCVTNLAWMGVVICPRRPKVARGETGYPLHDCVV